MNLLKVAACLVITVASLRDFFHFMVYCEIGLETGEIALTVLEILVKELLSMETSPDQVV